jgi:hypothetical protein
MIYMVDHVYGDPVSEQAWHDWYSGYLRKLISVPGISSAQRFKAIGCAPSRYLAMYSVDSAQVYSSHAYRNIGGGGSQSARFHSAYRLWTRNLFDSAQPPEANSTTTLSAPAVGSEQLVLVFDRQALPDFSIASDEGDALVGFRARTQWLQAVGLHMTTKYRGFMVLGAAEASSMRPIPDSYLYEPFTAPIHG